MQSLNKIKNHWKILGIAFVFISLFLINPLKVNGHSPSSMTLEYNLDTEQLTYSLSIP